MLIRGCWRFWRFVWFRRLVLISLVMLPGFWQREVICVCTWKHSCYSFLLWSFYCKIRLRVTGTTVCLCWLWERQCSLFPEIIFEKTAVVHQKWMKSWLTRLSHSYPINHSPVVFCRRGQPQLNTFILVIWCVISLQGTNKHPYIFFKHLTVNIETISTLLHFFNCTGIKLDFASWDAY